MGKIIEYEGFDATTYHADSIVCVGCQKRFCHTVKKIEDGEAFCKLCFNHRFGVESMNDIVKKLDEIGNYLWETPISDIKPELKKRLNFIGNPDQYL